MTAQRTEGDALVDEGSLPADGLNQVARDRGHPEHRDRIAEDENSVGAGTLPACEPLREEQKHCGEDAAFRHPEQEADDGQSPEGGDDAGEGGEDSPGNKREEDEAHGAVSTGDDSAGQLEGEVAGEEQASQQRALPGGDMQRGGEAGGGAEAEVGAVQVREAVGDEDGGEQEQPASAEARVRGLQVRLERVADHVQAA